MRRHYSGALLGRELLGARCGALYRPLRLHRASHFVRHLLLQNRNALSDACRAHFIRCVHHLRLIARLIIDLTRLLWHDEWSRSILRWVGRLLQHLSRSLAIVTCISILGHRCIAWTEASDLVQALLNSVSLVLNGRHVHRAALLRVSAIAAQILPLKHIYLMHLVRLRFAISISRLPHILIRLLERVPMWT